VLFQFIGRVPHWELQRLLRVNAQSDGRRQFSAWRHFLVLAFAQMGFRESLLAIEACLSTSRLAYRLGFRQRVTRNTLARANEERDWRLQSAMAQKSVHLACRLYQDEPTLLDLEIRAYAVDSTLIDLSLALVPWANCADSEAAVKLHTALDLRGLLPAGACDGFIKLGCSLGSATAPTSRTTSRHPDPSIARPRRVPISPSA
jgi:hypothetical protein